MRRRKSKFFAGPSTHNQAIERLWRDNLYYYLFYAMESTGILNPKDPFYSFAFTFSLYSKNQMQAFNHHKVCTEGNWSPYQMWCNDMLHHDNTLPHGQVQEQPSTMELYGYDPQGPSSTASDDDDVVEAVNLGVNDLLELFVLKRVDPLTV